MSLAQGILLGLVQGLTEFLPVSSSGHLVLVEALTGVRTPGVFVEVALHAATLVSVLVVYGRRLGTLALGVARGQSEDLRYATLLVVATIPAGVVGVVFQETIERAFDSLAFVGAAFVATGLMLWSTRRAGGERATPGIAGAIGIGCAQALAILPGISRSGSTVSVALWSGLSADRAAEFSFLMAVPVIAGATFLEARDLGGDVAAVGAVPLAASCALALATGIGAIRLLVALLRRGRLYAFAPYCWAVGLFTLGYALWRG